MYIKLENIGKKYGKSWIFRAVNLEFKSGKRYAILGNNGSGKSSLLKVIAGQSSPNQGSITFENTDIEEVYQKLSFCAPYIDLIEELTLEELLHFVHQFKPFMKEFPPEYILKLFDFQKDKWVKDYSSGMKQRVKLALALFADVELSLFDEPTSNLDEAGIEWFLESLKALPEDRIVIIASNLEREVALCDEFINMLDFKLKK